MNEPWSIQLFGGLRVRQTERVITRFRTQKTGALLAFLAYHRQHSQSRDVLIEMFWPDTSPESGRHNLSHALSSLRNLLEPPGVPAGSVIVADRLTVELNPDAFTSDVADFEQALRSATQARNTPEQIPLLAAALDRYTGPLLPDHYDGWIAPLQERLAQRFHEAAAQLIALREKAGDPEAAMEVARRAVSLDPLREEAIRELLRLLTVTGQTEAALRQYREYARLLEQQLGEEPGSALRQMSLQIEAQLAQSHPTLKVGAVTPPVAPSPPSSARGVLPSGTVTLLATEIEGATALSKKAGDAFLAMLSGYHALLRREVRRNGGHEVKETGDAFLVVFGSVGDALACAIACQRALDAQPWPEPVGSLRARLALHTGDVEMEDGEYRGPVLHRAARMLAAAHGGQTLCSEATAGLLKRDLDPHHQLKDLGVWRLRDEDEPERLFQAVYPGMANQDFPPLHAAPAYRAHLPLQFTRFFGRAAEITQIVERITSPQTRLLTLTGPGGTGKTRLCIEAVGRLSETFAGAIWFVPLADLSDPGLIPQAILHAMSIPLTGSQEPLDQVTAELAKHPTLLLLDNFEQLVAGSAEIVQSLLDRAPALQCLVTSRQTLNLPGESEFAVAPLPTPNGSDTPERLSLFESVRLFVDRAQAARPDFRITNSNAPAVAELCDRLEGIPLAIELAAARALVLTPSQMLVQLGNRFEFLVTRKRGIAERQRTLRATVDWSYRLLSADVQRFFAQLFVFRGGWTLEAAEEVCEEPLALDILAQLRECSLVSTQESSSGIRFRMLESLREYAEEQLPAHERDAARARHAAFFVAEAEVAEPRLQGPEQALWLNRLETEHDNLRAALTWCGLSGKGAVMGLRLTGAVYVFWRVRGHNGEGRARFSAALGAEGAAERTVVRGKALIGACEMARNQGDYPVTLALSQECLAIFRELAYKQGIAAALSIQGLVAIELGDNASARSVFQECLTIYRESGNELGTAASLGRLGILAFYEGDNVAARSLYQESLDMYRKSGNKQNIAMSVSRLGLVAAAQNDAATARSLYEESLSIYRELGHKQGIANVLNNQGLVAYGEGDDAAARFLYQESLAINRELGDKDGIANELCCLGRVTQREGDHASARSLYQEGLAIYRELGNKRCIAMANRFLGYVAHHEGDYASSRSHFRHCLAIYRELGNKIGVAEALEGLASVAMSQRRTEQAAQLFGASSSLREALGAPMPTSDLPEHTRHVENLRKSLKPEAFAAAWEAGRAMPWEQAVEYALEEHDE